MAIGYERRGGKGLLYNPFDVSCIARGLGYEIGWWLW